MYMIIITYGAIKIAYKKNKIRYNVFTVRMQMEPFLSNEVFEKWPH